MSGVGRGCDALLPAAAALAAACSGAAGPWTRPGLLSGTRRAASCARAGAPAGRAHPSRQVAGNAEQRASAEALRALRLLPLARSAVPGRPGRDRCKPQSRHGAAAVAALAAGVSGRQEVSQLPRQSNRDPPDAGTIEGLPALVALLQGPGGSSALVPARPRGRCAAWGPVLVLHKQKHHPKQPQCVGVAERKRSRHRRAREPQISVLRVGSARC